MSRGRVLVTGAGGFCGEHAVAHFAQGGYEVAAAVSRHASDSAVSSLGGRAAAVLRCDWTDAGEASRSVAAAKPDYIVHLAGLNAADRSWREPAAYLMTNAMGTVHLLEAVRAASWPCRVLVAGSMLRFKPPAENDADAAAAPPHPYSLSKTMQVMLAKYWPALYGIEVIVAEPSNLVGPGRSQGLCTLLAKYTARAEAAARTGVSIEPFRLSSRQEQRDFLDVRDAMSAYERLLQDGTSGAVYPIASGQFVTLAQLAERFEEMARCPLAIEYGQSTAPSPDPADISRIRALGWAPRVSLSQSLADVLQEARSI